MTKLPSLNGLRAISILTVVLFHLIHFNTATVQETLFRIPIFNGRLGVNMFFVISGFLITYLLLKEENKFGVISLKDFYVRRTLRIFPAYYFLLSVYWLLQRSRLIYISPQEWLTSLTYTKYLTMNEYYTSHTWSLAVEETFYLFWPMAFMLGDKIRKRVAFFLILIVPIVRVFASRSTAPWLSEQSLFTRIDAIAMGCFFALYKDSILTWLGTRWNKAFYSSIIIIFALPWLSILAERTNFNLIFVAFGGLTGTIANLSIAFILMYSAFRPEGNWYKLLNTKLFDYIGALSYSIYLWQQLFVCPRAWWFTHLPQNIVYIFIASLFSYNIIERPFLKLKARFTKRNRATPAPGIANSVA
jgi:peptidoglycan/LPS O-acetylase OafA/YrhL